MDETANSTKTMRLRYAGRCRDCGTDLAVGTLAVYDGNSRTVECCECSSTSDEPVFDGTAGASARREHERRKVNRETRIRESHPVIGGLILAMSNDPRSTTAWVTGASGEEALGRRLDALQGGNVRVLHDRRIRGTRANIDHIVVSAAGVFVIDAKKYKGRPNLRSEGGLFTPRTSRLFVGGRDCTKLVEGVQKQVSLVKAELTDIRVRGMLCFVEGDWPLIGGDFVIGGLDVLWPRRAISHILRPGTMDAATVARVHRALSLAFPPA